MIEQEAYRPKSYHNAAKLKHEYTLVEIKSYVIKAIQFREKKIPNVHDKPYFNYHKRAVQKKEKQFMDVDLSFEAGIQKFRVNFNTT